MGQLDICKNCYGHTNEEMITSTLVMCVKTWAIDINFLQENGILDLALVLTSQQEHGRDVLKPGWQRVRPGPIVGTSGYHTPESMHGTEVGDIARPGRYTNDLYIKQAQKK